jgi:mono/diheme cytochrome c family protein
MTAMIGMLAAGGLGAAFEASRARAAEPPLDGAKVYAEHCVACHGATMTGGDHGPTLKDHDFWAHWQGQSARMLYRRILSTMPASDPGTLTTDEALALVGHIARENGHPLPRLPAEPADLDSVVLGQ